MSHKVCPKAYRLKNLTDWDSRWLDKKKLQQYLEEDFKIRKELQKKIGRAGIERIEIERFPGKLSIIISSARPGFIIGRGGSGIEELKRELGAKILKAGPKKEIKLEIREVRDVWASAALSAQYIAQQLEKRIRFRKVLKQALEKIASSRQVKGARVEVGGRLDGAEIARREWLKKGRLPRQTIRADIDFAKDIAYCTYGTIGIKVWIYRGESFD